LLVDRDGAFYLEELSDDIHVDSAVVTIAGSPQTVFTGLAHLNGRTVKVVGDGVPQADQTVAGGSVTIATAATVVQIGLSYTHTITPLPANMLATTAGAHRMRLVRLTLRVLETQSLRLDVGRGVRTITLPGTAPPLAYTGDIIVTGYGWRHDLDDTLWHITSDVPLPFTLLSTTTELQVN
jgi:hypothetical protein